VSNHDEAQRSQIIGEYRLLRKLGGGGFGTVHLAEHIHKHSQVAIKILHQMPLTKSEDVRDFLNETRTMIRLHHPHIIPLLDVGLSSDDRLFLVMEYASKGTLRDLHPKGTQLPLVTIAEYVEHIASALQCAHDNRIIHRDVKPENMLLREDGTLLLSDFGIAKIIEHSTHMSLQKQIGTPAYMAPEQHKGYPCFASDQYSLAVLAYEWISGTRPFQGTREWLAVQHVTTPPPSLLDLLPTLHPSIEQVIFKALSKEPEQRFATVEEFAAAFRSSVQQAIAPRTKTRKPTFARPSEQALPEPPIINIPPVSKPLLANQPKEPALSQVRKFPNRRKNPTSRNQPYSADHAPRRASRRVPTQSSLVGVEQPSKAVKPFTRLFPVRRKSLQRGGVLLLGSLVLVLLIIAIMTRPVSYGPMIAAPNMQSYPIQVVGGTQTSSWQQDRPIDPQTTILPQSGPYVVLGNPSITADFINQVLSAYKSPAVGKGQALYDLGVQYGIDPVFALAIFMHESSFGTQGEATKSLSLGNLHCIPNFRCEDNFAQFDTWEDGFKAWYQLIRNLYVAQWGLTTVDQIIPRYYPTADNNNDDAYIAALKHAIDTWHAGQVIVR
jgi:serine/threonine protein kinase